MKEVRYRFPRGLDLERPKRPDTWRPFGLGAGAVLGMFFAAVMSPWQLQIVVLAAAGFFLLLAWGIHRLTTVVEFAVVRALAHRQVLTFVPARTIAWMDNFVTAYLLVFWVILLVFLFGPGNGGLSPSITTVAAVLALPVIVGYYVWQLTHPRGLTLTPEGIRGVRRGPKVKVGWDQILGVSVDDLPGRGVLVLQLRDHKLIKIDATRFGSDAHAVAHVITHFRDVERERPLLREGADVLERFGATRIGSA